MELVSSQTMQKAEKALSEKYGVDTLLLMENAGRGVTEEIVKFCNATLSPEFI